MEEIQWSSDYETGIRVIDGQHQRIIAYINKLASSHNATIRVKEKEVIYELIDYTLSHFVFEESLMDEAKYPAATLHARTHDAFEKKIYQFKERFENGEDISIELGEMLSSWLFNHIKEDDNSYVPYVLENMPAINDGRNDSWISKKIHDIFS